MPYPNEHSARMHDPGKYVRFRRENDKFGSGIDAIWGITGDGTVELQAVRFDASKFTADEARAWLKEHNMEPISFEAASAEGAAGNECWFMGTLETGAAPAKAVMGVAYTGAKMKVKDIKYPVVVDLSGLVIPSEGVPLLVDHENKTERRIGAVRASLRQGCIVVEGSLVDSGDAAAHVLAHKDWQLSIGVNVAKARLVLGDETVNGRFMKGPFILVVEGTLKEVSVVPLGADTEGTTLAIAAGLDLRGDEDMTFEKWLEARGWNAAALAAEKVTELRAVYDAESNGGRVDRTLDEIVANRQAETAREQGITEVAARAIDEYPDQVEDIQKLADAAFEAKMAPDAFELKLLKAVRPVVRRSKARREREEVVADRVVEAALCMTGGLNADALEAAYNEQELELAQRKWPQGLGLQELLLRAARQRGYSELSVGNIQAVLRAAFAPSIAFLAGAAPSTYSLPGILSNVANKFLVRGFDSVENVWRAIADIANVRDFKARTSYALTGGFEYELVPPGGELKHATAGEVEYTNQALTYGKMFAVTRQDIINDDLDALTKVPGKLGRGAALKLNKVFWTEFLAGHTSGVTFFPANNANKNYLAGGGSALSLANGVAALAAADAQFRAQTDPDGNLVGVKPSILLVPTALEYIALTLMASAETGRDDEAPTKNIFEGRFRVATSAYLSDSGMGGAYSAAYWYLLADPQDLPFIEVAFLNGKQTPTVESADADFNVMGVQFRGYHDFGVKKQEYRAGQKNTGS